MKVSIIIPVYNAQKTVKRALKSAINQNFPQKDFEVIVINDGSTDKTLEILKKFKGKIRLINQKNRGAVMAANKGFKAAKGDYVIKLDSDDYFELDILRKMTATLDENSKIDFVHSDYCEKNKKGKKKIVSTKNIFNILACGVLYRKNKLIKEGLYREDLKLPEYDLLLKTKKKWKAWYIPEPLYYFNRSERSLSGNKGWLKEALLELKKFHSVKEVEKIRKF